ncbi:MAG: hypothetical protein Sylvanvirus4_38 [Sylvanvirus sp.]|uniref:Uncharacterized protein n=1 Tax=Sylvanvirus sp. TaxID=2487774 RepID=A0A3G5AJ55_9VIRU|nr:MAG: hypothetical protein Sylvanvirus4_38 [Sylvanvirus sp.]
MAEGFMFFFTYIGQKMEQEQDMAFLCLEKSVAVSQSKFHLKSG